MTYATQTDLENAFGATELLQISDREGNGEVDTATVAAVLQRADSLMDGYLAARYALPLPTPVLVVITATAADLARYWLFDDAAPERVKDGYDQALAWLKDVSLGRINLPLPLAGTASDIGSPGWESPGRVFTAESLGVF